MNDMNDFWLGSDELDMMLPSSGRHRFNRRLDRRMAMRHVGRNICFGKSGGSGSAPAPDPAIGQAAMKNAEVGEQWLGFAKDQFTEGNKRLEVMDALTGKVINNQLDTQQRVTDAQLKYQEETAQWAREDRQRYKDVFQPLQDEFIKTAREYDSADNQNRVSAEATADMQKAADTQRGVNQRSMASMGINPNSGRFAGVSRADTTNAAIATAGAANSARTQVRDKALALRADAINMGAGLPSSTAAAYGLGIHAGNSATGNANAAGNSAVGAANTASANFYQNNGIMDKGFAGSMAGYNSQGSILNNLYGSQVNAWTAQQQANSTSAAGIGQLVGTGIGAYAAL